MRSLFGLLGLSAAAVALALLMGQNGATVTLFWPPYRVDMSFNLVLASILLLFLVLHLALRSVALLRQLPGEARRWRSRQRERALGVAMVDALVHQTAGRFVRAKRSAEHAVALLGEQRAAEGGGWTPSSRTQLAMAHLLAAEATHALQDAEAKAHHLEAALRASEGAEWPTVREAVSLRALRWAVDDRRLGEAQNLLERLPQGTSRRTVALRIKLKLAQLMGDQSAAFETARLLAKHKAFSPTVATSLLRRLRAALFTDCHDEDQLQATWARLDAREQADPVLIQAALDRLVALKLVNPDMASTAARTEVNRWVLALMDAYTSVPPDGRFALARSVWPVLPLMGSDWLPRIEQMQREHAADPGLQLLAGETYFVFQLWGKAEQAFQQAVRSVKQADLAALAWVRLAELADRQGRVDDARKAWQHAALINTSASAAT